MNKKKLLIILLILFIFISFFFVLIGFFVKKEFLTKESLPEDKKIDNKALSENNYSQDNLPSAKSKDFFSDTEFLGISMELQNKIKSGFLRLTKDLAPDPDKRILNYINEITNLVQDNIGTSLKPEDIKASRFINFVDKLTLIKPPVLMHQFHLELIRIYYSIAIALEEIEKTDDNNKRILLYNFIKNVLAEVKF